MGQRGSGRILHRSGDGGTAPCVVQGGFEIPDAQVEHIQRTQQPQLVEGVATFLGDREASVQRHTRRIATSAHEHQRHSQGRLKMHLLEPAASGIVESEKRPLRPAMTFRQQRHRQKNRRGGGGKSDADFGIAVGAKAPFQSRADIVEAGKVRRPFRARSTRSAIRSRSAPAIAGNRWRGARPGRRARRRRR